MQEAQTTNYKSVRNLLTEQAASFGDKIYMVSIDQDEKALSYAALHRLGNRMAHYFAERGVKVNDRILMLSVNSLEFIAVFQGVQRCGATIAIANVEINRAHIGEILHAVDPVPVLFQACKNHGAICIRTDVLKNCRWNIAPVTRGRLTRMATSLS